MSPTETGPGAAEEQTVDLSVAGRHVGYISSMPEDMTGVCALEIGPQHLNRLGVLHGGFVALLLDNGCGLAVRNGLQGTGASTVTISLTTNFIAAARSGRVVATGRVVGGGRSVKFASSELRDESGQLLATASGTFRVLEAR